ncbi:WD repeat protein [Rhodotorula toruloides]|uniref:WD repeat protein n=1 Tax=Rhodotorula toruloides TaxID=5286 RepID=A0A511KKM9_RHOTO|nr:WD repeat protein [Rhodotorula toruloides]
MYGPASTGAPTTPPQQNSIRDGAPTFDDEPSLPAFEPDHEDTFHQLMSIMIDEPIGSMSISPANRDVALGARKGLFVVDLQNPYDPPRFLPHNSSWEVADVQWNPFPHRSEWVVSTSNQQAVVYNLSLSPSLSSSPVEHTLYGHTRAVTDINWSPGSPEVLATCAMDGWVMAWDLRAGYWGRGGRRRGRKPIWRVCGWGAPATQVKFNRREPHVIASSHANVVNIWDDRMGAEPVTTIKGHTAKIYGIDWCRKDSKQIITCSLDKSFKSWRISDTDTLVRAVETTSPIWRARWLPFGDGMLTLPQRSDHALSVWSVKNIDEANEKGEKPKPVVRFEDDRQFQLVTWAKDRRLRLWPISDEIAKDVGHVKGSPIEVPVTRRGGPDISYRSFAEAPAPPLPLTFSPPTSNSATKVLPSGASLLSTSISQSPASTPSLLTSSLLKSNLTSASSANKENLFSSPVPYPLPDAGQSASAATMTTTKVRSRRQKEHDRLAWMEGVKIIRPLQAVEAGEPEAEVGEADFVAGDEEQHTLEAVVAKANSVARGTDAGTATAREGEETERAESVMSRESMQTGTAIGKDILYANLGEEITSVVRRFPRVNFEKVHVAGRTCTVSLYSPLFIRATFSFPKGYPASSPPAIELERSIDVSLKQRANILQGVRRLMSLRAERGLPSFEQALRYLLGDRSVERAEEEEDDEAEEGLEGSTMNNLTADVLRNNINVPPPRRGGASFSPSGQLTVFFPTNVFVAPGSEMDGTTSPPNEPELPKRKFPLRLSEVFGYLPSESTDYEGDYQETDEALQVTRTHNLRSYPTMRDKPRPGVAPGELSPAFSTIVKIKDVSHLTVISPSRSFSSLGKPAIEVARENALGAIAARDLLLAKIWKTVVAFFESGLPGDAGAGSPRLDLLLAERMLQELLKYLAHLRDIQTLGIIACLLELHTRDVEMASRLRSAGRPPEIDYFSQRHRPIDPIVDIDFEDGSGEQTPLPTTASLPRLRGSDGSSYSPRPSWANLSGFFNSSMLSLRSASPNSPSSPDRPGSGGTRPPSRGGKSSPSSLSPGTMSARSPLRAQQAHHTSVHHASGGSTPLARDGDETAGESRHQRTKTSPNVTFGATSVALIPSTAAAQASLTGDDEKPTQRKRVAVTFNQAMHLHKSLPWWLSPRAQLELELIRLSYAELLNGWGRDTERAQVLKLCRAAVEHSSARLAVARDRIQGMNGLGKTTTIEQQQSCTRCGTSVKSAEPTCPQCRLRQRAVTCILCHLPVNGLVQSCSTCCHVGHLACLSSWFNSSSTCPSGCGCSRRFLGPLLPPSLLLLLIHLGPGLGHPNKHPVPPALAA